MDEVLSAEELEPARPPADAPPPPPAQPPPKGPPDRRWIVHLVGYTLVAAAIYFGLRARAPSETPALSGATSTAQGVAPPQRVVAPGSASVAGPAEPPLPSVPSIIPPPGSDAGRARATERAQSAMDQQRAALAKACFKPGSPAVTFTVRLLFDKTGKELRRSLRADEGAADEPLLACLGDYPHPLRIDPLDEQTSALVKLRFP